MNKPILICGGGISGLVAGILLLEKKFEVILIDDRQEIGNPIRRSGNIGINKNGLSWLSENLILDHICWSQNPPKNFISGARPEWVEKNLAILFTQKGGRIYPKCWLEKLDHHQALRGTPLPLSLDQYQIIDASGTQPPVPGARARSLVENPMIIEWNGGLVLESQCPISISFPIIHRKDGTCEVWFRSGEEIREPTSGWLEKMKTWRSKEFPGSISLSVNHGINLAKNFNFGEIQ